MRPLHVGLKNRTISRSNLSWSLVSVAKYNWSRIVSIVVGTRNPRRLPARARPPASPWTGRETALGRLGTDVQRREPPPHRDFTRSAALRGDMEDCPNCLMSTDRAGDARQRQNPQAEPQRCPRQRGASDQPTSTAVVRYCRGTMDMNVRSSGLCTRRGGRPDPLGRA